MALKNHMMKIGPCIFPVGSPSNSSRCVSCDCMISVVGSGCVFLAGDGGGAGGSAGDCDSVGDSGRDGSRIDDVVTELSDEGLADREVSVDIGGTIVSALGRPKKRPFASRVFIFIIYLPRVLCEATTRRYVRTGQNLTGTGTLILDNWDF